MNEYTNIETTYFSTVKSSPEDVLKIEIGDSKQPDFYPQVKVMRWDNEVNLSVRLKTKLKSTESYANNIIKWDTKNLSSSFYSLPVSKEHPEGGYEFDITLNEKPTSNKIEFSLQTKGLDFFYQGELTQEEIDEGVIREDRVVGSYAVYHNSVPTNYVGSKLYKSGKFCHIYRPKIYDSKGEWVWGKLSVDVNSDLLVVEIPQDFLDNALYPITKAAGLEIGYTTVGTSGTINLNNASTAVAVMHNQYLAVTGDTITKYSFYGFYNVTTTNVGATIYSVTTGNPNARLAAATTISIDSNSSSPAWHDSGAVSQALTNGVTYCVAFSGQYSANTVAIYYDNGTAPGRINSTSTTLDDPFSPTGTDSGRHYSMYATYISGGQSQTISVSTLIARLKSFAPTIIAGVQQDITISANTITNRLMPQGVSVKISTAVSLNAITMRLNLQSPSVKISAVISANVQKAQVKINSASIKINYVQSVNALNTRLRPQSPTIAITGNVLQAVNALIARLVLNSPTITISGLISGVTDTITKLSEIEQIISRNSRINKNITKKSRVNQVFENNSPLH